MKILAVCGNGMGTSNIIKMKIQKITQDLGIKATVEHASIAAGKSKAMEYDVVFCSNAFLPNLVELEQRNITVIGVKNLMSEVELKEKFEAFLQKKNAKQ